MVYEYECLECGNIIEVQQKISDNPLVQSYCDVCKKEVKVKKLISSPTFILKGSGWAKDGYSKPTK